MIRKLGWLTLGAFAIGTEGYVIAGLLPSLAADLHVSIAAAGQIVTAFALTYALAGPVLAVATGSWHRDRVLRTAMGAFAAANFAASMATNFGWLVASRLALAGCAALFMATAGAYAAASVAPTQRGRAMSLVYMGLTVATVLGVPVGTIVGHAFGWRSTFVAVGSLAAIAFFGLCLPLQRQPLQAPVRIRERLEIARQPEILIGLLTTVACMAGAFSIYTYMSPLLHLIGGYGDTDVAWVLMLFGIGSAIGNIVGGRAADSVGPAKVIGRSLIALAVIFVLLSAFATWLPRAWAIEAVLVAIFGWGVIGWSFPPAQQLNLVQIAPQLAPVLLSLNASAIYLGISTGAVLGSIAVANDQVAALGFVGAACEMVAVAMAFAAKRRTTRLTRLQESTNS
jgi:predicted MFS family arabinose efflux permease